MASLPDFLQHNPLAGYVLAAKELVNSSKNIDTSFPEGLA